MSRRQFVQALALLGAQGPLRRVLGQDSPAYAYPLSRPGHVVRIIHDEVMRRSNRVNSDPYPHLVEAMVDTAVVALTETTDIREAWSALVSADDHVLIKISCLGAPNMATNEPVVYAIVRGLVDSGIPADQITIYDQYRARMLRAHFRPGEDILGAGIEFSDTRGHSETEVSHPSGTTHFANALLEASAVINVPVVKDHTSCGIGVSFENLALGLIDNPTTFQSDACSPALADLYNCEEIRGRTRLTIADGLRLLYDGGPDDNARKVQFNSVLASTDPVALDTVCYDFIDEARVLHRMAPLEADGRGCDWLGVAESYGLGIHDRDLITVEEHRLG